MKQSLDGVILRVLRAKSLDEVKSYEHQLLSLIKNYQYAKEAFEERDILGGVKEFFDYYVVEKPQQSGEGVKG